MLRRGLTLCLALALQIFHQPALFPEGVRAADAAPLGIETGEVIADFEAGVAGWRADFRELAGGRADLAVGDLEATPLAGSEQYLYLDFRSRLPTGVRLQPAEPVRFDNFVRRIEFWLLNGGNVDEVALDLIDARGKHHRLRAGRLAAAGWQQLRVRIPPEVLQRDPQGRTGLRFVGLYFSPARRSVATGGGDEISLFSLRVYADHFIAFTRVPHRRPSKPAWSQLRL